MKNDAEYQAALKMYLKESNPNFVDLCEQRKERKDYQDGLF